MGAHATPVGSGVRIVCENCASTHDLDPPAWVVSSGRAFRFRCAACGHAQMVPPPTNISLTADTLDLAPSALGAADSLFDDGSALDDEPAG